MRWLLNSNTAGARLLRTIIQGLLGVLATYLADIIGLFDVQPEIAGVIAAAVMAILSPIMSKLGEVSENAYQRKLANAKK